MLYLGKESDKIYGVQIETMKLTKIMFNNNLTKPGLEFHGRQMSTLISQYINACLHYLLLSTLNIKCERCLKQVHKVAICMDHTNIPEGVLHANE